MSYDANFDETRLGQLSEQYLTNSTAEGRVLFLSDSDDNRLDHTRWQMDDVVYDGLSISGFKLHLMELLDILMVYRAQNNQPHASRGVVLIGGNELSIEWLAKREFASLFEE